MWIDELADGGNSEKDKLDNRPSSGGLSEFDEKIRTLKIQNDNMASDQGMKEIALNRLFWFLWVETLLVFALAFLQGFGTTLGFYIEEWCFSVLTSVTIAQIATMLIIAITHLFPRKP